MIREAVYKITENCPCNCSFCDSREKYENILKKKTMTYEQWKIITDKLLEQGLEVVVLSGGEPLLNKDVTFKLIKYLQMNNVFVVLNASGALFLDNHILLDELILNFPDLLVFSIDSIKPNKHDTNRSYEGLFDRVTSSIKYIKSQGDYPIAIRTVITKNNYKEIPEIIENFYNLGVDCVKLTNIENDIEGEFRLNKIELDYFNDCVKKDIVDKLKKCNYEDTGLLTQNINKVMGLLDKNSKNYEYLSNGIFSPNLKGNAPCDLNGRFFAIQSNGDVLPCCEAEHHYEPLLGNILNQTVEEILTSNIYNDFKNNRPKYCVTCTQSHNIQLDFVKRVTKVDRR